MEASKDASSSLMLDQPRNSMNSFLHTAFIACAVDKEVSL
jgi:hypothetical protein